MRRQGPRGIKSQREMSPVRQAAEPNRRHGEAATTRERRPSPLKTRVYVGKAATRQQGRLRRKKKKV